jgi:hypothetical protein
MTEMPYFDDVKELRAGYFVEYHPASEEMAFATMSLTFVQEADKAAVAEAMLRELTDWIKRYGVPVMVSAWDDKENRLEPQDDGDSFLVGWRVPSGEVVHSWRHTDLDIFLKANPSQHDWRAVYRDVPFKTDAQVKENAQAFANERRLQNKYLKAILFGWLAIIPAGIALFQYFGPEWLGLVALMFGLWKAGRAGFRLWRNSKPRPWEEAKAEKQRKMNHYFHHCEQNPEGFARLKAENFEREAAERTQREFDALTKAKSTS